MAASEGVAASAFVVTHGAYSDYSVDAVFEDRATAQRWVDAMNEGNSDSWGAYRVEEHRFVRSGVEPHEVTEYRQSVELYDDGTMYNTGPEEPWTWWACNMPAPVPHRPVVQVWRFERTDKAGVQLEVRAKSPEEVARVIGERIAAWKSGAWDTRIVGDPGSDD